VYDQKQKKPKMLETSFGFLPNRLEADIHLENE